MASELTCNYDSVKKRWGGVKIICVISCYVCSILNSCGNMYYFVQSLSILGLCCAVFLLLLQILQQWQLKHENVDIFKYEARMHGLFALGFGIVFIICIVDIDLYYYYFYNSSFFPWSLLLSSIGFSLLAVEAHMSYRVYAQQNVISNIKIPPKLDVNDIKQIEVI